MRRRGLHGSISSVASALWIWVTLAAGVAAAGELGKTERPLAIVDATHALRIAEYAATARTDAPGTFQAPNRAQGFRTSFSTSSVTLEPRDLRRAHWRLEIAPLSIARGAAREPLLASPPRAGARVDYARGPLAEWYRNGPAGLELGCDLAAPFARVADASSAPLTITWAVSGTLEPIVSASGSRVDFEDRDGARIVALDSLHAIDAAGRELAVRFESARDRLAIVVEDRVAVYPIVVDPTFTGPGWNVSGDQDNSATGLSVCTAGDVNGDGFGDLIIGAPLFDSGEVDEGKAFVFLGGPTGLAANPAATFEGNQVEAFFAHSVSTAGDVNGDGFSDVVIGAPGLDAAQKDAGAALVILGGAAGIAAAPQRVVTQGGTGVGIGASVACAGDVDGDGFSDVLIGADRWQDHTGGAFLFRGSVAGIGATAAWSAVGSDIDGGFGAAVATAGDVDGDGFADVLVGAPSEDGAAVDAGRARLYRGSPGGCSAIANWSIAGSQVGERLGGALATAGDVDGDGYSDVVIGARNFTATANGEGRVLVFHGSGTGLEAVARFTANGGQLGASLGASVFTAGDLNGDGFADVAAGSPFWSGTNLFEGRALVFGGSSSGLSSVPIGAPSGGAPHAWFGAAVAPAGDVNQDGFGDLAIGAPGASAGAVRDGEVLVFHGGASGPAAASSWTWSDPQSGFGAAITVAGVGDVDGDGIADVVVGLPDFDAGFVDSGRVCFFRGTITGIEPAPSFTLDGTAPGMALGRSVAAAGDVNGDGASDIVLGAPGTSGSFAHEGSMLLVLGAATGPTAAPATRSGGQANAAFGASIAGALDANGDGYSDIVVGAPGAQSSLPQEGEIALFSGSASGGGISVTPTWLAFGKQQGAALGAALDGAGDVDADGYSEFVAGAPSFDGIAPDEGAAFLYRGGSHGPSSLPDWAVTGGQAGERLGAAVAGAGDVNDDGRAEVAIGAPGFDSASRDAGRVLVYAGIAGGLTASPAWTIEGSSNGAGIGSALAGVGDVDGDGSADLLVGALVGADAPAVLRLGGNTGLAAAPAWSISPGDALAGRAALSIARAGDVNGDGLADLLIAVAEAGNEAAGVHAWIGGGGASCSRPRLVRSDGIAPIAFRGVAPGGSARSLAIGRSPFGRGRVRLDAERSPLGQPFGGSITSSGTADSGVGGAPLWVALDGLSDGPWRWRARVRFDPVTTPFQQGGRFLHAAECGVKESSFRARATLSAVALDDASSILIAWPRGAPAPTPVVRHVLNVGAPASALTWTAVADPPAPWLAIAPSSGGDGDAVALTLVPVAAVDGFQATVVRFTNTLDPTDVASVVVSSNVTLPRAVLGLDDVHRIEVPWVVGTPGPAALTRHVIDVGDPWSGLAWSAEVESSASWLHVEPPGGLVSNQTVSGASVPVTISFSTRGLAAGVHSSAVVFRSIDDPAQVISVIVDLGAVLPDPDLCVTGATSIVATYTPGDVVPPATAIAVGNCGAADSVLTWSAIVEPPCSWISVAPSFGSGLAGGAATPVTITIAPNGLAVGTHTANVRFVAAGDPSDAHSIPVGVEILTPPSNLVLSDASPIRVDMIVGDVAPAPLPLEIANAGDPLSTLVWTVSANPPVAWMDVAPHGGTVPGGSNAPLALTFFPAGFPDGRRETTLSFVNVANSTDRADLDVSLILEDPTFVPGDRLIASLQGAGDAAAARFEGVVGMRLLIRIPPHRVTGPTIFTVADDDGVTVRSWLVRPNTRPRRAVVKLRASGHFTLTLLAASGPASVDLLTDRRLPRAAQSRVRTRTLAGSGASETLRLLALPDTTSSIEMKVLSGVGRLQFDLFGPDASQFDVEPFLTATRNGGLSLREFPLHAVGDYRARIVTLPDGPVRVRAQIRLAQPPLGNSTIVLK